MNVLNAPPGSEMSCSATHFFAPNPPDSGPPGPECEELDEDDELLDDDAADPVLSAAGT